MTGRMPGPLPVAPVLPGHPGFTDRYWPSPRGAASGAAVVAAGAVGLVAALFFTVSRPGLGWLMVGLTAAVGTAFVQRAEGTRLPSVRWVWAAAAVALLAVGTVRAAGWLFALCVPMALACAGLALAGGRTTRGLAAGAFALPVGAVRAPVWFGRGVGALRRSEDSGRWLRLIMATGVGVALLVVFGALFASADRTFADLLGRATPDVDGAVVVASVARFVVFGWGAVGLAYLVTRPPTLDRIAQGARRPVRRMEWLVPIVLLDALFLAFVAVQMRVWFGGDDYVRRTAGLTYAEYARGGFWQLTVVTVLTLAVIAVAARKAPRDTGGDRTAMRVALGALAVLALVVVVSALARMAAYEDAYGLTRLRLLVFACEVWFGSIFVMVLAAGTGLRPFGRQKGGWLPRTVFGVGVAMLLGLATLNPDRLIADRNIDRYETGGQIDVWYLAELSADAAPAIDRLPEPARGCALYRIARALDADPDAWYEFNAGRSAARRIESAGSWPVSCSLPPRS
jgi:hypothetical protein